MGAVGCSCVDEDADASDLRTVWGSSRLLHFPVFGSDGWHLAYQVFFFLVAAHLATIIWARPWWIQESLHSVGFSRFYFGLWVMPFTTFLHMVSLTLARGLRNSEDLAEVLPLAAPAGQDEKMVMEACIRLKIVVVGSLFVVCPTLCVAFGLRQGGLFYATFFLPHHCTYLCAPIIRMPLGLFQEFGLQDVDSLRMRLERDLALPEADRAGYWVRMSAWHLAIEERLDIVWMSWQVQALLATMIANHTCSALAMAFIGWKSCDLAIACGALCLAAASLACLVQRELWPMAVITSSFQSRVWRHKSVCTLVAMHLVREGMTLEARLEYMAFSQHTVAAEHAGVRLPLIGQVTKAKLATVLRAIAVLLPTMLGYTVRSFTDVDECRHGKS